MVPPVRAGRGHLARASPGRAGGSAGSSTTSTTPSTSTSRPSRRNKLALIWEGEDGAEAARSPTASCGSRRTAWPTRCATLGVGKGDRVGIFMPMVPEVCIASLACSQGRRDLHADLLRLRRAEAVASRLHDCEAKLLITADGFYRRGRVVPMKEIADEAVAPGAERRARAGLPRHRRETCRGTRAATSGGTRLLAGAAAHLRDRAHRPRRPVHADLHLRHDRPAEGRGPRPRRLPDQGDPGHGPLLRRRRAGHHLLVHRHRLDDGAVADRRRADARRDRALLRGHARLSRSPTASGSWSSGTASPSSASRRPPSAR